MFEFRAHGKNAVCSRERQCRKCPASKQELNVDNRNEQCCNNHNLISKRQCDSLGVVSKDELPNSKYLTLPKALKPEPKTYEVPYYFRTNTRTNTRRITDILNPE